MSDPIERQAAIDEIEERKNANGYRNVAVISELNRLEGYIMRLPSAQPERKTGRWIPQDHNKRQGNVTTCMYYCPVCSECGHTGDFGMNFCQNCGTDMRGGAV